MQKHLRRGVVDFLSMQPFENGDVVRDVRQVRQQLGNLLAALAVTLKPVSRAGNRFSTADECETLSFQRLGRTRLPVKLDELRLVIEQIELRRGADHVQINYILGLGRIS